MSPYRAPTPPPHRESRAILTPLPPPPPLRESRANAILTPPLLPTACESKTSAMSSFLSGLEASGWLRHIRCTLEAAQFVAASVESGTTVLVHCSDGWDRTSQTCGLAELLLDPYYRTLHGFQVREGGGEGIAENALVGCLEKSCIYSHIGVVAFAGVLSLIMGVFVVFQATQQTAALS